MSDQHEIWAPMPVSTHLRRQRSGFLPTLIVAAAMVGWLVVLFLLATTTTDIHQLPPGVPIQVGSGVSVRPTGGWREVSGQSRAGSGQLVLQKDSTRLSIEVGQFSGTDRDLLDLRMQQIVQQVDVFRPLPSQPANIGGDPNGLAAAFSATQGNVQLDGQVAVLVHSGLGIIATSVASARTLQNTQADVQQMLAGMELPR